MKQNYPRLFHGNLGSSKKKSPIKNVSPFSSDKLQPIELKCEDVKEIPLENLQ